MSQSPTPAGATVDRDTVSATDDVDAAPSEVFDFLSRPANHAVISGDRSVRGAFRGPARLQLGSRFGMRMKMGVPYRITSQVVEFDQDRRIAWAHFGGHRWRWELEPLGVDRTRVTETFDMSTSRMPALLRLMGYPKRHEANVSDSLRRLVSHFQKA